MNSQTKPVNLPSSISDMSAIQLSTAIHRKSVSCREVMAATLAQIKAKNPLHNAIVALRPENDLLAQADQYDEQLAKGQSMGWLHGIPQAIKDISPAAGLPFTMGSPLLRNNIAASDSLISSRVKDAGAIVIGKTNTPEFGLGSHTFNEVYGATRNAFNPEKTAGGSSGGSAVALAKNMLCVADGSDFMGSLRNPAGWNNIYGMRPSNGRVPMWPATDVFVSQLSTEGPMARHVEDMALLLQTQSGFDARVPLSIHNEFRWQAADDYAKTAQPKIAWLKDFDGYLPFEPGVLDCCESAIKRLSSIGCRIETSRFDFSLDRVWQAWLVWRAALVASRIAVFASDEKNHSQIKPEALWEYRSGLGLTGAQFMQASSERSAFYQYMVSLFNDFDFLVLPSAQVWPFDIDTRWPTAINGRSMDTYHRWMEVVIYATFAGLPVISVPAGFSSDGLPMGLQIIGKPQADLQVLQLAAAYEKTLP